MTRWTREPGFIEYQRRSGGDAVLEPVGQRYRNDLQEFIMVCGIGSRVVWIRWYARDFEDARRSFGEWLEQPWQKLTTDIYGNGIPNGYAFKPSRIDWFEIVD